MNSIQFLNELMQEDHESVVAIHYGDKQFEYLLTTHSSTWNHDTFLQIMQTIQEKYGLTQTFRLFERVGNEQLIIDDIDDIIAIFDNGSSDVSSDENDKDEKTENSKIAHIYIKDNDTIERENWQINSFCSIYSRSKRQWFDGKILEIYGEYEDEWLVVKYNNKSTKEIQRNSRDIKPVSPESILSLRIASKCLILSEYSNIWYQGQVISVLNDDEGEWLAIKYKENDLDKIADIQRYSKQLKLFNIDNYNKLIVPKRHPPDTMIARIDALKRMNNQDRDKEIKRLLTIFSNILKSPFNSKYQSINMKKLKEKFTKYPICIELLYDAGFKKSAKGTKLIFNINNMKLLKKTNKAVKKEFNEIAKRLAAEQEEEVAKMQRDIQNAENSHFSIDSLIHGSFEHRLFAGNGMRQIIQSMNNPNKTGHGSGWQKVSLFG